LTATSRRSLPSHTTQKAAYWGGALACAPSGAWERPTRAASGTQPGAREPPPSRGRRLGCGTPPQVREHLSLHIDANSDSSCTFSFFARSAHRRGTPTPSASATQRRLDFLGGTSSWSDAIRSIARARTTSSASSASQARRRGTTASQNCLVPDPIGRMGQAIAYLLVFPSATKAQRRLQPPRPPLLPRQRGRTTAHPRHRHQSPPAPSSRLLATRRRRLLIPLTHQRATTNPP